MRFCSQNSIRSCGPFAIINALKVFNVPVTIKDKPRFMKLCKTPRSWGTFVPCFDRGLRKALKKVAKVIRRRSQKPQDLARYLLETPTAFLYASKVRNGKALSGHWVVTIPQEDGKLKVVNGLDETVEIWSVANFLRRFGRVCFDRDGQYPKYPQVWTLKGK